MIIDVPAAAIEPFSENFPLLNLIAPDLVHHIERAILNCLRNSMQMGAAPNIHLKDSGYSMSAMGWLLAAKARRAGAIKATYTLDYIRNSKKELRGVTYTISFTVPGNPQTHQWHVTQRFMIDRYRVNQ